MVNGSFDYQPFCIVFNPGSTCPAQGNFKFPFEIGSSCVAGRIQTAVTILLTHIACTAQARANSSRIPGHQDTGTPGHQDIPSQSEQAVPGFPFWFAIDPPPRVEFWVRRTWHKIKCSILIELMSVWGLEKRTCSQTLSWRRSGSFWQSCVNKWPGAFSHICYQFWVLGILLTWLFMLSGLWCLGLGLFYFVSGSGNHRGLDRHVFTLGLGSLYFCASSGTICLIMSAKCLSLCSCYFVFFGFFLCLCHPWMYLLRFYSPFPGQRANSSIKLPRTWLAKWVQRSRKIWFKQLLTICSLWHRK